MGSTSARHVNHLKQIMEPIVLQQNKKAVTIICDGGLDWTPKSTPNVVNYGRLWCDLKITVLILTSYNIRHSCFNPIECSWAPLLRWLTGMTNPIAVEGKTSPWVDFADLMQEEILKGKAEVLD